MSAYKEPPGDKNDYSFGYLMVWPHPSHGYLGGYLIVCSEGRPIEFHCTAPVMPSRAQEILYGPTLQPYLLGEIIGARLLDAARQDPSIVITDQFDVLHLHSHRRFPFVLLGSRHTSPSLHASDNTKSSAGCRGLQYGSGGTASEVGSFTVGDQLFELPSQRSEEREMCINLLQLLSTSIDLAEPFERIELAIREAQRIGNDQPEETNYNAA